MSGARFELTGELHPGDDDAWPIAADADTAAGASYPGGVEGQTLKIRPVLAESTFRPSGEMSRE